jgi:hypothetical protein
MTDIPHDADRSPDPTTISRGSEATRPVCQDRTELRFQIGGGREITENRLEVASSSEADFVSPHSSRMDPRNLTRPPLSVKEKNSEAHLKQSFTVDATPEDECRRPSKGDITEDQ